MIPPGSMAPTWVYVLHYFYFSSRYSLLPGSQKLIKYKRRHDGVEEHRIVLEDMTTHGKVEGTDPVNDKVREVV